MPAYEVIADEVTVPKSLGAVTDRSGNSFYEHENRTYLKGEVIPGADVSPVVVDLYEAGDAHITASLKQVDDDAVEARVQELEEERERKLDEEPAAPSPHRDTTAGGDQPPFVDYDELSAKQVVARVEELGFSPAQRARVARYEREYGKGRTTILELEEPVGGGPAPEDEGEEPAFTEPSTEPADTGEVVTGDEDNED